MKALGDVKGLSDVKFLRAMDAAQIPPALFGHREHLRLAFLILRRDGADEGRLAIVRALRRYTTTYGIAHIFDEELTLRWIERLLAAMAGHPEASTLDALLASVPELAKSDG